VGSGRVDEDRTEEDLHSPTAVSKMHVHEFHIDYISSKFRREVL
jgi:hypothetical protein